MHDFTYQNGELCCEQVPISRIVKDVGTPCYIYSHATLIRHFRAFDQAFKDIPHIVAYAMKANSNIGLLRLMASEGSGVDIVSGGELQRALHAGVPPSKIVFAGVGKSPDEIRFALRTGILMFNVESPAELQTMDRLAGEMGVQARVALRINPDIDPKTHPYISTGLKQSKFGISAERASEEFQLASTLAHIQVVGVHTHIGSQLTDITPFVDALKKVLALIAVLRERGIDIQYLNIGGGLGITYENEVPPHPTDLAEAIYPYVKDLNCQIIMEPGRVIVGNAGVMVTQVLYAKHSEEKQFLIVDAGMNDLLRPSLYEAYHEIRLVHEPAHSDTQIVDVVGPVCESGDFLAKDRSLPTVGPGGLLAVMSAGAYGFVMSSNYNSRPRPPEILVKGDTIHVIRTRETFEDLIRGESIPAFL